MKSKIVSAERLREVLHYDADTGHFTWLVSHPRVRSGDSAGCINHDGYICIRIDGSSYMAHRLAWLYMTGEWPAGDIDHKYGIRNDNRWSELRVADHVKNGQNQRKAQKHNKCGLLGVYARYGRWRATIRVAGKGKHLGCFDTPAEAHAAYLAAKAGLHPFQTLVEVPRV